MAKYKNKKEFIEAFTSKAKALKLTDDEIRNLWVKRKTGEIAKIVSDKIPDMLIKEQLDPGIPETTRYGMNLFSEPEDRIPKLKENKNLKPIKMRMQDGRVLLRRGREYYTDEPRLVEFGLKETGKTPSIESGFGGSYLPYEVTMKTLPAFKKTPWKEIRKETAREALEVLPTLAKIGTVEAARDISGLMMGTSGVGLLGSLLGRNTVGGIVSGTIEASRQMSGTQAGYRPVSGLQPKKWTDDALTEGILGLGFRTNVSKDMIKKQVGKIGLAELQKRYPSERGLRRLTKLAIDEAENAQQGLISKGYEGAKKLISKFGSSEDVSNKAFGRYVRRLPKMKEIEKQPYVHAGKTIKNIMDYSDHLKKTSGKWLGAIKSVYHDVPINVSRVMEPLDEAIVAIEKKSFGPQGISPYEEEFLKELKETKANMVGRLKKKEVVDKWSPVGGFKKDIDIPTMKIKPPTEVSGMPRIDQTRTNLYEMGATISDSNQIREEAKKMASYFKPTLHPKEGIQKDISDMASKVYWSVEDEVTRVLDIAEKGLGAEYNQVKDIYKQDLQRKGYFDLVFNPNKSKNPNEFVFDSKAYQVLSQGEPTEGSFKRLIIDMDEARTHLPVDNKYHLPLNADGFIDQIDDIDNYDQIGSIGKRLQDALPRSIDKRSSIKERVASGALTEAAGIGYAPGVVGYHAISGAAGPKELTRAAQKVIGIEDALSGKTLSEWLKMGEGSGDFKIPFKIKDAVTGESTYGAVPKNQIFQYGKGFIPTGVRQEVMSPWIRDNVLKEEEPTPQ